VTLEERIFEDMKEMLVSRYGLDVDQVTGYNESTRSDGYCDTCWYEYNVVEIDYLDSTGNKHSWEYSGKFGELIQYLTSDY
jgi:hypothetical protein